MQINCGLENETYKYEFGIYNYFTVPFDENKKISLTCARNDWAAAQLLLYSKKEMVVCINEEPYFYEKGPIDIVRVKVDIEGIKKEDIKLHLIGLIEDDDRQKKSDILLDCKSIYVEPRKVQAVWIEVVTDEDVNSGTYKANIKVFGHRMFEEEKLLRELSYDIRIVSAVLKKPSQYDFYLDLWQHNCNIARKYDVQMWSDNHFKIIENYIASLADLGQKAITVVASEIPWSGQMSCYNRDYSSNLFEYNMVKVIKDMNGNWKYNFDILNRYISLCMKYGISEEIEVFGLINVWLFEDAGYCKIIDDSNDGIRIRYFDEKEGIYKYIRKKEDLCSYIKALERNFTEKGWIDKVRVVADEPSDVNLFTKRLNELKKMAPSFQYKTAINHISFIEEDIEGIKDYVPKLPCICKEFERTKEIKKKIDGKFLYYVCCNPDIPNTFICSPLIEARIIPWLTYYLDLDGFLRWNYTVWPNKPMERISYRYPNWKAGDTNFVYPGKNGKPMLTLRYKNLKRGIRDYEIFRQCAKQNHISEKIREKMKDVFYWENVSELHPEAKKNREELYSLCYEDYEKIIKELLNLI